MPDIISEDFKDMTSSPMREVTSMKLTSIKDYLKLDPESTDLRLVRLLLAAVRLNAVRVSADECELFRADLESLESQLNASNSEKAHMITGKAVRCIEQYGRTSDRILQQQTKQMQGVVSMLTDTIALISSCDQAARVRLKDVEKQLEGAMEAGDIIEAKARLGVCLDSVRAESARRDAEREAALDAVRERLRASEEKLPGEPAPESTRSREQAEKAIQERWKHPSSKLILFRLNTMALIRKRFGEEVAETVMAAFIKHLKKFADGAHTLFSWSGNCVVTLVSSEDLGELRRELGSPNFTRFEVQVDRGGPSAYVASQVSSVIVPLRTESEPARLFERIDQFAGFGTFHAEGGPGRTSRAP